MPASVDKHSCLSLPGDDDDFDNRSIRSLRSNIISQHAANQSSLHEVGDAQELSSARFWYDQRQLQFLGHNLLSFEENAALEFVLRLTGILAQ